MLQNQLTSILQHPFLLLMPAQCTYYSAAELILFTFMSCICHNLKIFKRQMFFHILQEGDPRHGIGRVGADIHPCDVFGIHPMLHIISWFELSVEHCVFFHPHECRIWVCLGVTITFPADIEILYVFLQPLHIFFQKFHGFLQCSFSFARPMPCLKPYISMIVLFYLAENLSFRI